VKRAFLSGGFADGLYNSKKPGNPGSDFNSCLISKTLNGARLLNQVLEIILELRKFLDVNRLRSFRSTFHLKTYAVSFTQRAKSL
jgi:hypothetical protein